VQSQLGAKRNWTDSDDLCIMFKAAYTTDFYRAVREALHAEVDSWRQLHATDNVAQLWQVVNELESVSRVSDALELPAVNNLASSTLVPVEQLTTLRNS
jgi:anaerobic magnesium-protoporphyrin IX monomethyl ester cyclase